MKKVGFIGWRGMVGSVLMSEMRKKNNFNKFHSTFFSTSQSGKKAPNINNNQQEILLQDAWNIELLRKLDIILTCQGSNYTNIIYSKLRKTGWLGYWIDSASFLRMKKEALIILDPINQQVINQGIKKGIKTFVGGNCTVSLMLMSLGGLFTQNLIEWISVATYQAASGYGARAIYELITQVSQIHNIIDKSLKNYSNKKNNILDIEHIITQFSKTDSLNTNCFKIPLINNLIPWIGESITKNGQTQEEWKGQSETNKILNIYKNPIVVDSMCVRIGTLRCHSQAFTIKLREKIHISEIEQLLQAHNTWVKVIPNNHQDSLQQLHPIAVSGTLNIPIGRIKKLNKGENYISAFSVGDQLLWGASEPLRRMLLQLV